MDNDSFFHELRDDRDSDKEMVDSAEHFVRLKKQSGLQRRDDDLDIEKQAGLVDLTQHMSPDEQGLVQEHTSPGVYRHPMHGRSREPGLFGKKRDVRQDAAERVRAANYAKGHPETLSKQAVSSSWIVDKVRRGVSSSSPKRVAKFVKNQTYLSEGGHLDLGANMKGPASALEDFRRSLKNRAAASTATDSLADKTVKTQRLAKRLGAAAAVGTVGTALGATGTFAGRETEKKANFAPPPDMPEAVRGDVAPRAYDHEGGQRVGFDTRKGYNFTGLHHEGKHHILVDHHASGRVGHLVLNPESGMVEHSEIHPSHKHMEPKFHEHAGAMRGHLTAPAAVKMAESFHEGPTLPQGPKGKVLSTLVDKLLGDKVEKAKTAGMKEILGNPTRVATALGAIGGTGLMMSRSMPRKSKGGRSNWEDTAESRVRGQRPGESGLVEKLKNRSNEFSHGTAQAMREHPIKSSLMVGAPVGAMVARRLAKALGKKR